MILDLIRHGDTGRRGCFDGRHDPPLLADACAGWRRDTDPAWGAVISSPRQRAMQTAQALVNAEPIQINEDWAEWHFGDWDGRHRDDIASDAAGRAALAAFYQDPAAHPPPHAESWSDLRARVERGLRALCSEQDDMPVLVVTHAGPMRLALSLACGFPLTALWALRVDYGTRVRLRIGVDAQDRLWGELIEVRQA